MSLENFDKAISETPRHLLDLVDYQMNILDRLNYLLNKKFNGKQKALALVLGKKESEVSKWFSGTQNFTLSTLMLLQRAFEEEIIFVASDENECDIDFQLVKTQFGKESTSFTVNSQGMLQAEFEPATY